MIAQTGRDRLVANEIMNARSDDTLDIQMAISTIVKARQQAWKKAKIKLQVNMGTVPIVRMSQSLFNEIMYNLLSNAERAIRQAKRDKGAIEISVQVEESRQSQTLLSGWVTLGSVFPKITKKRSLSVVTPRLEILEGLD